MTRAQAKVPGLDLAARTASVSYHCIMGADQLRQALLGEDIPPVFAPHLGTLLDEATASLLTSVVEQIHREAGVDRSAVWKRMRELAQLRQSLCDLWH